jgi:hypothetical protein
MAKNVPLRSQEKRGARFFEAGHIVRCSSQLWLSADHCFDPLVSKEPASTGCPGLPLLRMKVKGWVDGFVSAWDGLGWCG